MHNFQSATLRGYWVLCLTCLYFAWGDIRARYKRSILGPFWLVIGTAIGVVGLGFVWSTLLEVPRDVFIPSLTIGLVSWQFLSGCITEAPSVFLLKANVIRNMNVPPILFVVQLVLRHLFNFLHNLIVVFLVMVIYPQSMTFAILLIIPGLALIIAGLVSIVTIIAFVSARYRDLGPLIQSLMPLLFFLTPVIYRPEQLSSLSFLAWLNPLTYLIGLIRDPVLGVWPGPGTLMMSLVLVILVLLLAIRLYHRNKQKLVFWL